MPRFDSRPDRPVEPDSGKHARQASEFLDQYHPRASMAYRDQVVVDAGKVLERITSAMERVDLDIDTPVSIEEDVATADELVSLIVNLRMGDFLAVHVVNTAIRIMSARYPTALVRAPLPPTYDLRKLVPLKISEQQHQIAKMIFNRRTLSDADLTVDDVAELARLDLADQIELFVTLFYMYGTKLGAMKQLTGIK